jgi:porphobilinogen synthase
MMTLPLHQDPSLQSILTQRPRRNRKSEAIRGLIRETHLHPSQLVVPLFLLEGSHQEQPIQSMPGVCRRTIDLTLSELEKLCRLGIQSVDLFTVVPSDRKDQTGSEAIRPGNLLCQSIRAIKTEFPHLCVMADIALDPFTSHGHDGIVDESGTIVNDETLLQLGRMSLLAAEAGADVIAPSDMMDGRIGYLRRVLDESGHMQVSILSYTAKYASAFYGPFRDALHSAPKFGDKKSYQMDPANGREALREALLDQQEGADLLLVKPALAYLDIIHQIKAQTTLPLGAYHVSGEYSMVMAAAEKGWLDADRVFMECLTAIRRAGADFILSYAAPRIAERLYSSRSL